MASNDKKDSCRSCPTRFKRCDDCMTVSKSLKRKYQVGLTPGYITSKHSNSGAGKSKDKACDWRGRHRNSVSPPGGRI